MIYELPPISKHPPSIKRSGSFDDTQPQKPDIQTFVETRLRKRKATPKNTISQKSILHAKKSPKNLCKSEVALQIYIKTKVVIEIGSSQISQRATQTKIITSDYRIVTATL